MTTDLFSTARELVSMDQVVRGYGFTPNRAGFISCPFHADKTPSLKLYKDSFYCFGCGAHGDVIDFAAQLFGLSPLDALKRLDADFNLHLQLDKPIDQNEAERRRKTQEARVRFEKWREKMLDKLGACIRIANIADFDNMTAAAALALVRREWLEDLADTLLHGDLDNQMQVFRDREGVDRLCGKILRNTPTRSTAA